VAGQIYHTFDESQTPKRGFHSATVRLTSFLFASENAPSGQQATTRLSVRDVFAVRARKVRFYSANLSATSSDSPRFLNCVTAQDSLIRSRRIACVISILRLLVIQILHKNPAFAWIHT
jgi:hypothetical protein